jgi:hypothetical protein
MNIKITITFYFVLHLIFQDTLCKPLYIMVFIPIQSLWYQVSHESQHIPAVFQVTALLQEPQGYFSVLGPGFGS